MSNEYEDQGRLLKMRRLADACERLGITAEEAAELGSDGWQNVLREAKEARPASTESLRLTVRELGRRERVAALMEAESEFGAPPHPHVGQPQDPFDGLPDDRDWF